MNKTYICIDLKSFYASCECIERNLDPLTTNLVVADSQRTEKTICLAVTPALKSFKIPGRARLFEVVSEVDKINKERLKNAPLGHFTGESSNLEELNNPNLKLSFIIAKPQMAKYIEISTKIYNIYLKYVSALDIHVYSIDEVFIDITNYLSGSNKNPFDFTKKIIKDVLKNTGITATAGIGTNLYLAKIAMDINAKKLKGDKDGVRIAYLDELSYRKSLWDHRPLTDFWRIGKGLSNHLEKLGLYTMGDIARCSIGDINNDYYNENLLFKEFGINAELIIDHAWGYEPTTIQDIKSYKPKNNSLGSGQVLDCGYKYDKGLIIVKEMIELLSLDLVRKKVKTNNLALSIGYDIENLKDDSLIKNNNIDIGTDYLGRKVPKSAHKSISFKYTSSTKQLLKYIEVLYKEIVNPILLIRRINISFNNLKNENNIDNDGYKKISLFEDYDETIKSEEIEKKESIKENNLQKAIIKIKNKHGKNSLLKGMNLEDGAKTKERNEQIGGHRS